MSNNIQFRVRQDRFNTGIVSPGIAGRLDLEKRTGALRRADNAFLSYEGPVQKRAGQKYLGAFPGSVEGVPTYRDAPLLHKWTGTEGEGDYIIEIFRFGDPKYVEGVDPPYKKGRAYIKIRTPDGLLVHKRAYSGVSGVIMRPNPTSIGPAVRAVSFKLRGPIGSGNEGERLIGDNWRELILKKGDIIYPRPAEGIPTDVRAALGFLADGTEFIVAGDPRIAELSAGTPHHFRFQEVGGLLTDLHRLYDDADSLNDILSPPIWDNRLTTKATNDHFNRAKQGSWEIRTAVIIETPYRWEDIWHDGDRPGIQVKQSRDVMTFVHRKYPPQELVRAFNNEGFVEWSFRERKWGPTTEAPSNISLKGIVRTLAEDRAQKTTWDNRTYDEGYGPAQAQDILIGVTAYSETGGESPLGHAASDTRIETSNVVINRTLGFIKRSNESTGSERDKAAQPVEVYGFDRFAGYSGLFCRVSSFGKIKKGHTVILDGGEGSNELNGRPFLVKTLWNKDPGTNDSRSLVHPASYGAINVQGNESYRGPWIVLTPEPPADNYSGMKQSRTTSAGDQNQVKDDPSRSFSPVNSGSGEAPTGWNSEA